MLCAISCNSPKKKQTIKPISKIAKLFNENDLLLLNYVDIDCSCGYSLIEFWENNKSLFNKSTKVVYILCGQEIEKFFFFIDKFNYDIIYEICTSEELISIHENKYLSKTLLINSKFEIIIKGNVITDNKAMNSFSSYLNHNKIHI